MLRHLPHREMKDYERKEAGSIQCIVGAQQYAWVIGEYYVATGSVYPCLSM